MIRRDVLLFAGLRETARTDRISVDVHEHATVRDLLDAIAQQHPILARHVSGCRVAVDLEFVSADAPIASSGEIALIPPVSGGHDGRPPAAALSHHPLALQAVIDLVDHPGAGGIATFTGNVRRVSRGQEISHLEYEAYGDMATKVMSEIVRGLEDLHPGCRVAMHHRLGRLEVGETAVVIAASAPHREEAFAACRGAIEALKRDVPIWKREVSTLGATWIGQGP